MTPTGWTAARWTRWPSPAAAWTPSGSCCWWAPGGRPRPPALTGASRSCIWSRCPRQTPASCWTGSLALPAGGPGLQVLAQAAGNPMALIELAKVIADDPAASRRWAAEPLPLTDRLSAVITSRFAALPEQAQAALLLAAVADGPDLRVAASHGAGPDARALTPAEQLGLVKVDRTGLQFSHPLVRSAIYHSAPFAQRAAAHRQLAEALHDQPDRRAWHLAAAALQPDEYVASLLEATAAQAQHRGGAAAAALALERAAELSPDRAAPARRLVAAASAAVPTGQGDWVQELARRALAVTADPELRLTARHDAAWALAWSGRRSDALSALISVAEEASRDLPALALGRARECSPPQSPDW